MTDEEKKQRFKNLTRSNIAAQMAMLGYEPDGNPKDMVEVVRCKDCKHGEPGAYGYGVDCDGVWHDDDWFCADGERRL